MTAIEKMKNIPEAQIKLPRTLYIGPEKLLFLASYAREGGGEYTSSVINRGEA